MRPTIANVDMAAAWDGDEGEDWARGWERYDRSIRAYHHRLMAAASVSPGEQVLDVGCGNGQSTRDAARAAHGGWALGVDLSSRMLERARERARVLTPRTAAASPRRRGGRCCRRGPSRRPPAGPGCGTAPSRWTCGTSS